MMNAYEKAKQLTAKWEQERKDSKRLATMKEAERRIQVREFDNMLCLFTGRSSGAPDERVQQADACRRTSDIL